MTARHSIAQLDTQLCNLQSAESGGVRPFGVSLLLAGRDENGPQLYQIDPSGSYFAWKASAIGKHYTNAKTFLEKRCVIRPHLRCQSASCISWPQFACSCLNCRDDPFFPSCCLIIGAAHVIFHTSCVLTRTPQCHYQVCRRHGARGCHPHSAADAQGGLRGPDRCRQHRGGGYATNGCCARSRAVSIACCGAHTTIACCGLRAEITPQLHAVLKLWLMHIVTGSRCV